MNVQASKVAPGTIWRALIAGDSRPSTLSSCVADFAKKISSSEFQPMIEMSCIRAGMIQPLVPNCGLVEATESMP